MSNKALSPSKKTGISNGQISKLQEMIDRALKRFGPSLRNKFVAGLEAELLALINEERDTMEFVVPQVNYSVLTGPFCEESIWEAWSYLPTLGKGVRKVKVVLFRVDEVKASELPREYEKRGLVPDPYAQAAMNGSNPKFAAQFNNTTLWPVPDNPHKEDEGKFVYLCYGYDSTESGEVGVSYEVNGLVDGDEEYDRNMWFVGVPAPKV